MTLHDTCKTRQKKVLVTGGYCPRWIDELLFIFSEMFFQGVLKAGAIPRVCACVRVYLKSQRRFIGLPGFCMGHHAEKCRKGFWVVMYNVWCCWDASCSLEVLGSLDVDSPLCQSMCFFRTSRRLIFCPTWETFRYPHSQIVGLFLLIQDRFFQVQKGNLSMEIRIYGSMF